jgi:hypothetical protein
MKEVRLSALRTGHLSPNLLLPFFTEALLKEFIVLFSVDLSQITEKKTLIQRFYKWGTEGSI